MMSSVSVSEHMLSMQIFHLLPQLEWCRAPKQIFHHLFRLDVDCVNTQIRFFKFPSLEDDDDDELTVRLFVVSHPDENNPTRTQEKDLKIPLTFNGMGKHFQNLLFTSVYPRDEYEKWRKLFLQWKTLSEKCKNSFHNSAAAPAHARAIVPCSRFIWIPKPLLLGEWGNFPFEFKMKMAKILCHASEIKEVARNRSGDESAELKAAV